MKQKKPPTIKLTPTGIHILKCALALFAEALGRNGKALPNMNLTLHSLTNLQQKVEDLTMITDMVVEFDFNEAVIFVASLNMYLVDTLFFPQTEEDTSSTVQNCQSMIAYFTAIQGQRQPD